MAQLETEFAILHKFVTHPGIVVRRGQRRADGRHVILKCTAPEHATDDAIARLAYEHAMLTYVHNTHTDARIIAPLQLWGSGAETTLVLDDSGGFSLHDLGQQNRFSMEQVLHLGQEIAETLALVHAAGVIHKDVNPRNVVFNSDTGQMQLIDFGIAVRLDREVKAADGQGVADGTLAFAPPEQVGRMARYADHRSDYYSLGATLYDLLCGRPPFVEESENKLMHMILTATPVPPSTRDPRIPEAVSQVVMRLLDKMQERRYRSARGIAFDLWQCAEVLGGRRDSVTMGQEDRSERFELPDKVYGRAQELRALHQVFQDATQRRTTVAFLGGPSGIGKSALVGELQADLVGADALFASGKHDQLRRHMPFSALSQAVSALVRGVLHGNEAQLTYWRRAIQGAMGTVGQALVEVVPTLELLVGAQKPVIALPTRETENRLHYLWQRVIHALCRDRPLLLFLDDLQWADHGTIQLLNELLYQSENVAGLCIVAAYRDNEIAADHPLARLFVTLQEQQRPLTHIALKPLDTAATEELLRDATGAPAERCAELAPVVHAKTQGNPFFARAYLQHLHRQHLLFFDVTSRHFAWDLATVQGTSVTDNVVQLLSEKLRVLSPQSQRILSTAACLGNQFYLHDLQHVAGQERARVVQAINDALADGLLVPLSANYRFAQHTDANHVFKFSHDRIQQAVFELMPAHDAMTVQHTIGTYMLQRWRQDPVEVSIFDTLGHLNAASALLQTETERLALARLNLTGAQEAKRAGALAIALTYLQVGLPLLGDNAWNLDPQLKRDLELELADNEFLSGAIQDATARLTAVVQHTQDPLHRAAIDMRRVQALTAAGQLQDALRAAVDGLRALGVAMPYKPKFRHQVVALVQLMVAVLPHRIKDLPRLPATRDARHMMIIALANSMKMAAFYADPAMFAMLGLTAPRLTMRYGSNNYSAFSLGLMGLVLVQLNQYSAAKALATLTREAIRERPDSLDRGAIEFAATAFIEFVDMHPDAVVTQMHAAYVIALEAGDPLFGGWAAMCSALLLLFVSLPRSERELTTYEAYVRQRNEPHQMLTHRIVTDFIGLLRGDIDMESYVDDGSHPMVDAMRATGGAHWACVRLMAAWLMDDHSAAWEFLRNGRQWRIHEVMVEFLMPFWALFGSFTLLRESRRRRLTLSDRAYALQLRLKLRAFARAGAVNYAGIDTLLAAMQAAQAGPSARATALFDAAVAQLVHSEYVLLRAVALECGGRYFMQAGKSIAARGYLDSAMDAYRVFGADAKVHMLDQEFALTRSRRDPHNSTLHSLATATASSAGTRSDITRTGGDIARNVERDVWQRLANLALRDTPRDEIATAATAALLELSSATRAVVSLGQMGQSGHGVFDSAAANTLLPLQLLTYTFRAREVVFSNDVTTDNADHAPDYVRAQSPLCYCALPMVSQNKSLGVLYLENNVAPGLFTPARLAALQRATALITMAFELQEHRHNLIQLAHAQALALRDAADRVVQQERESTETQLAGGFAHEMRNALTASAYPLEMLAASPDNARRDADLSLLASYAHVADQLDEAHADPTVVAELRDANQSLRDAADEVARGVRRALVLTQEILDYAQASRIIPGSHRVRIQDVCTSVLNEQQAMFAKEHIAATLEVPHDLFVYIAEPHAYAIARNIISNARDAVCMRPVSQPRSIVIRAQGRGDTVHLSVQDSGVGIDEAQRPRIFQPFYSTKGTRGTGLGLGFTRKVVLAYGGKIDFVSQPGMGTTFEVELPIAKP